MSRVFQLLGPMVLSVAVLYSGIAWAFPRCAHSFFDGGALENPLLDHSHESDVPEIGCFEGDYQIGVFGETSSAPRMTGFSDGVRLGLFLKQVYWLSQIVSG